MKDLQKRVRSLCQPSFVYLVTALIILILVIIQNVLYGDLKKLCVGSYSCYVTNVVVIFIIKLIYIAFWTIVLDALCKYGYKDLSWFLVIFPFVLAGVLLGYLMINNRR